MGKLEEWFLNLESDSGIRIGVGESEDARE